jgi:hypothetical protein
MSAGPIPWTAVEQYARVDTLNVSDTYMLHRVVRHLDGKWLDKVRKKQDTDLKSAKAAKPTPGRKR